MGVQVVPAVVVFQTPPEAAATSQVVGVWGSTAMSMTRPPTTAGPMLRNSSPAKVEAVMPPFFSSGLAPFSGTPFFWLFLTPSAFLAGLALVFLALRLGLREGAARQQEPAE